MLLAASRPLHREPPTATPRGLAAHAGTEAPQHRGASELNRSHPCPGCGCGDGAGTGPGLHPPRTLGLDATSPAWVSTSLSDPIPGSSTDSHGQCPPIPPAHLALGLPSQQSPPSWAQTLATTPDSPWPLLLPASGALWSPGSQQLGPPGLWPLPCESLCPISTMRQEIGVGRIWLRAPPAPGPREGQAPPLHPCRARLA